MVAGDAWRACLPELAGWVRSAVLRHMHADNTRVLLCLLLLSAGSEVAVPARASRSPTVKQLLAACWWQCWRRQRSE